MVVDNILEARAYEDQKLSAKIKMLYVNLCVSAPVNFLSASIIFFSLYHSTTNTGILKWYIAVFAVTLFRMGSVIVYHRYSKYNLFLYSFFIVGAIFSAMTWGFCASYLMPPDNLLQQTIIIVIVAGVSAGALQMFQASFLINVLYLLIMLVPVCVWLILQDSITDYILGGSILSYLIFAIATAWRGYKSIEESLQLRFDNMALIKDLSASNTQLVSINSMNEALQTCQELDEAYSVISHGAEKLFSHLSGGLIIANVMTNELETVMQWGEHPNLKKSLVTKDCWALRTGHAYIVNDFNNQLMCSHFESQPEGGAMCVPQISNSGVIGVLVIMAKAGQVITTHQQQLANTFNDVIKLSLINIRLLEILNEQTIRDPLTSLYNRRFLDETLPRELIRIDREKAHLCVCMVDIDFFKQFNDTNGHEAGDEALKILAKLLTENIRKNDIACRLGGEEFVLVFIDTDLNSVMPKVQKICENIKNARLTFRDQLLSKITVSVGVAQARIHGHNMKDLLRSADEALYTAKQNGRDQIVVYDQQMEDDKKNIVVDANVTP